MDGNFTFRIIFFQSLPVWIYFPTPLTLLTPHARICFIYKRFIIK